MNARPIGPATTSRRITTRHDDGSGAAMGPLVPVLGAAGVAGFLLDWRIPLMLGGLAVNLVALAVAGRRLLRLTSSD